jgi:hypothetical protein
MWWWSNPPKTIYTIKCIVRNREKGTAGKNKHKALPSSKYPLNIAIKKQTVKI